MRSAFYKNDDGWGMMRLSRRKNPIIKKGLGKGEAGFQEFLAAYNKYFAKYECAIHFRWATCGEVSVEQSHPYEVTPGVWLMHNGHFAIPMYDNSKSDTWHFSEMLNGIVQAGWLRDTAITHLLEEAMGGSGNRLVLMDSEGFQIFNAGAGLVIDGVWYSNNCMWNAPTTQSTGTQLALVQSTEEKEREYEAFWLNMLETGGISEEDAPPDIRATWDNYKKINHQVGNTNIILMTEQSTNDLPDIDEGVVIPQSKIGWASLSKNMMKRIAYENPDAVVDALFDLLQG
jgi:hypothetical protein